jgi:putative Ca2+/H+ antiporter (TMEM165/GDT1 family)
MSDLRIPIGSFFSLVGAILIVVGLGANYQAPLESANVNLYCGVSMLIFGAVMLWLARRKSRL